MCGIAGIYNFKSDTNVKESEIAEMISTIHYRGPDGDGIYTYQNLGLGHKRLSILDTNTRSNQPMIEQDGRSVLCYNGEVYNYLEIATELKESGTTFSTTSDTEVVLKALDLQKEQAIKSFNGMYGFAYWDRDKNKLLLVRDRLGIKPLFYMETNDGVIFGSEIKTILSQLKEKPNVNKELIDCYMSLGYVPTEQTLFKDIKKVPPGHYLSITPQGMKLVKYWDMSFDKSQDKGESYYISKTQDLLEESIKLQLRSDVPLGVFLSGGIDSSAVVALMRKLGVKDIKTFSVAWDYGKDFDETEYARKVADQFQTDHTEYFMSPEDFKDFLPNYIRHMDEPVTEAAALSLYYLSLKTKEKVTVVLSGEGSDEVFGGYPIYQFMDWVRRYQSIPSPLKRLSDTIFSKASSKLDKYVRLSNKPLSRSYAGVSFYDEEQKESLYSEDFERLASQNNVFDYLAQYYQSQSSEDNQSQMQYLDVKTWLVDDLLVKADRMSMAASLELRVPFLDHNLLEFSATMPSKYRNKNFENKYIIKKAMEPLLDKEILYRKKQGFPTPLSIMFKGDLKHYLREILDSELAHSRGYFKPSMVRQLLSEHINEKQDHHKILWQLLVLELWHREYIDDANNESISTPLNEAVAC